MRSLQFESTHQNSVQNSLWSCIFVTFDMIGTYHPTAFTEAFLVGLTYLAYGQKNLARDEFATVSNRAELELEWASGFCEKASVAQVIISGFKNIYLLYLVYFICSVMLLCHFAVFCTCFSCLLKVLRFTNNKIIHM